MNPWHLRRAVHALREGGLVLHATEGVWGLACDPFDDRAVARLLRLKGRSVAKGLIVIGAGADTFAAELAALDVDSRSKVEASWPGAVTWILPNTRFPTWITGGRDQVAMRVPGHPQARALARAYGGPLVSTSANRSGRPPARSALQARRQFQRRRRAVPGIPSSREDFPTRRDYVLPGEVLAPGAPSQIRTPSGQVLRGQTVR